jgi:hypothetical protein
MAKQPFSVAIEAALEAERMHTQTLNEQRRVVEMELQQARYDVTMRARQQLVRALITDIIADADRRRVMYLDDSLTRRAAPQLRVCKPRTGEHSRRTTEEALAVIRSMLRPRHSRLTQPHAYAHGAGPHLERKPCEFCAARAWRPCLSFSREEWRMADNV